MNEKVSLKIEGEEIVFADLTNRENLEAINVCKGGNIYSFDFEKDDKKLVGKSSFDSVPNLINDFNPLEVLQNLSPDELSELFKNQSEQIESIETIAAKMLIL